MTAISGKAAVDHPTLHLLGPIELLGAVGTSPPRAGKQCLEYCAWLLEHQMVPLDVQSAWEKQCDQALRMIADTALGEQKASGIEVVSLPPRPVSPQFKPIAKKPA